MSKSVFCIRNTDIYKGVCEKKMGEVATDAIEKNFEKGYVFYEPSRPATDIYVIKNGEVELYQLQNGKKIVIETLFAGDTFGDFGAGETTHYARALRKTYICRTPSSEFLKIVKTFPEIALNLLSELVKKTQYYENKIAILSAPAKDQLFYELKNLANKNIQKVLGKIFKIPLRISHQKLADKTGLNRVTVTKLMKKLKDDGYIKVDESTKVIEILK